MAFNETACDIHLSVHDGGTHLIAICNNDEGSGITGDLLLDQCLGNKDGKGIFDRIHSIANLTLSPPYRPLRMGRNELQQECEERYV
jgi:hypothetical protein